MSDAYPTNSYLWLSFIIKQTATPANQGHTKVFGYPESAEVKFIFLVCSGGFKIGGPEARLKRGPLMTSSHSTNRDKDFWSRLRYGHRRTGARSWNCDMTDTAEWEIAKGCSRYKILIRLKNGKIRLATQTLGNRKLVSPPLFYFHAPFPCIHHQ